MSRKNLFYAVGNILKSKFKVVFSTVFVHITAHIGDIGVDKIPRINILGNRVPIWVDRKSIFAVRIILRIVFKVLGKACIIARIVENFGRKSVVLPCEDKLFDIFKVEVRIILY